MDSLVQALYDFDALREGDQISQDIADRVEPTFADTSVFQQINPKIVRALRRQGVNSLYTHQGKAIDEALQGKNIVLEAPTASGKTLSFSIPMMQNLLEDPGGHALMMYPMNAVANDQRDQLAHILESVGLSSAAYNGDTRQSTRKRLRDSPPDILITNPEMLHFTFLGWNKLWTSFLKNLRFVVIDEMHEYRGYFGSNMSLLLRRFAHHMVSMGVSPQYFLATATCANPEEHAKNLTGQDFQLIQASGKSSPKRHFVFIDPDIPTDNRFYNMFRRRIVNAALACITQDKSVIIFCPTIKFAESCYSLILRLFGENNIDPGIARLFKAGITAKEKSDVQTGMKSGSVRVVFSTNALELGIDVGGLDGVILAGFPDTVMSAWQRIGRAGRGWDKEAFVLFYAMNNPVDKFHAANLRTFLEKPLDEIVADSGNEELIIRHTPSLLYESSGKLHANAKSILGDPFYEVARGAKPIRRRNPPTGVNLRGISGKSWVLMDGDEEVGTMSDYQRFREAFQDAVLIHGGTRYI